MNVGSLSCVGATEEVTRATGGALALEGETIAGKVRANGMSCNLERATADVTGAAARALGVCGIPEGLLAFTGSAGGFTEASEGSLALGMVTWGVTGASRGSLALGVATGRVIEGTTGGAAGELFTL